MSRTMHSDFVAPAVLVAEDDALIRMAVVEVLSDAGFTVFEAADAEQALDALRGHADEVRALFTDVNMPGRMDGLELARRARRDIPGIAVLIASGNLRPSPDRLPPDSSFLHKPYDLDKLPGQLRALMSKTG